jgi:hypothetical protein
VCVRPETVISSLFEKPQRRKQICLMCPNVFPMKSSSEVLLTSAIGPSAAENITSGNAFHFNLRLVND